MCVCVSVCICTMYVLLFYISACYGLFVCTLLRWCSHHRDWNFFLLFFSHFGFVELFCHCCFFFTSIRRDSVIYLIYSITFWPRQWPLRHFGQQCKIKNKTLVTSVDSLAYLVAFRRIRYLKNNIFNQRQCVLLSRVQNSFKFIIWTRVFGP